MNETETTILIVDDEKSVRTLLRNCFEKESFTVFEAGTRAEMFNLLESQNISLITLDISLGSEDGLEIARELRTQCSTPIIMVSGKGDLIDTVVGLEMGADDYISKPFELREVIARVRAVLRRYKDVDKNASRSTAATLHKFNNWILNSTTRELHDTEGNSIPLTTGEYELLYIFVSNSRCVLSRDQIMDNLKGREWVPNDRTIDNQVARLRKKLEADDNSQPLIKTVRGAGYLFTAEVV